jgi:peptidoglycan/xylan/chitin deacetylase (PgdA/CDA1 family)
MIDGTCLVAMYHYVRDAERTEFPALRALSTSDFSCQLDLLASSRAVIGYDDFETHVLGGRRFEKPAVLLTFDDGFAEHRETVLPLLTSRGLTGVFFVAGDPLGDPPRVLNVHKTHFLIAHLGPAAFAQAVRDAIRDDVSTTRDGLAHVPAVYRYDGAGELEVKHLLNYELPFDVADRVLDRLFVEHLGDEAAFARRLYLSRGQVGEMARAGMTFGFHGERHRVLSRLDESGQRHELQDGRARIGELTGQGSAPFCYPYGHPHTYNAATLKILREAGYPAAFNTVRRLADPASDSPLELPRYDTRDLPPFTQSVPHA